MSVPQREMLGYVKREDDLVYVFMQELRCCAVALAKV